MLISDKTLSRIDKILDRYIDAMIVFTAGKDSIPPSRLRELYKFKILEKDIPDDPLVNRAYWIGKLQTKHGMTRSEAERALDDLKNKLKGQLGATEIAALNLAGKTIVKELERHKDVVKNVISDLVLSGNYTYRNATATPHEALESALLRRESVGKIAAELRDKTGDMFRDWKRVAITELTNTMNSGAVDQIIRENKGIAASEIYCYKPIPVDDRTCKVCKKVYLEKDEVTPKIYTLSELIDNGTNVGKKQAEWKAVIGATHPHCRGKLVQLPNGWGFEKGTSNLKYYGPDFLWARDKDGIAA